MGMLLIFLGALLLGMLLMSITKEDALAWVGFGLTLLSIVAVLGAVVAILASSAEYRQFRDEGVELRILKSHMDTIDPYTAVKITDWNSDLQDKRSDNDSFMWDAFIDDRVEQLEPIK